MTDEEQRAPTPIDAIAESWVATELELFPELHVYLGFPGREGESADYSPDGARAAASARGSVLAALSTAQPVDEVDRITKLDLTRELTLANEKYEAGFDQRDLNVIESPAQGLREIFDLVPTASVRDWENVATRLRNLPTAIDGYIVTLQSGIEARNVPAIRQVTEVISQANKLANGDGFFSQFVSGAKAADTALPESLHRELEVRAARAAEAYAGLSAFLRDELAPHAPVRDAVGREHYALASRDFLGATVDLDQTYEWGIDELARMTAEQESIASEILPGATVHEAIAFLDNDASRKLHGTPALQAWMQETSDRASRRAGAQPFRHPEPELRRLECRIAPTNEGGIYYTGPSDDFSRAGRMWWSVPDGVTEFDTWRELTTVYHEGVPGHHLQVGQATYNKAQLNTWRRSAGTSGHAEGWALYAERLMEQLGYLDDPADRLGMLDGQRMRAARVVLDIGVHLEKELPGRLRYLDG